MAPDVSPDAEEEPHPASAPDTWGRTLQRWAMEEQCADSPLYWGPHRACRPDDWVPVRNTEHLAVLVSTAVRADNNVCFVSETPDFAPRHVHFIGLIRREVLGWAVIVHHPDFGAASVQRHDYPYDNYDSFSALTAATVARTWITAGTLPEGLIGRFLDG